MDNKYFIQGEVGNEYIMYGNEVESVYVAKVMSHSDSKEMILLLNRLIKWRDLVAANP